MTQALGQTVLGRAFTGPFGPLSNKKSTAYSQISTSFPHHSITLIKRSTVAYAFRPISLQNYPIKAIAKVLTNRIEKVHPPACLWGPIWIHLWTLHLGKFRIRS
jgi:hypothetical protein